ncbi:MAG: ATP-binding protein, partial [Candidatus Thorarchaeota archaeon]
NPFHVTEGVHIDTHIGLLVSCFMAAWPVYGILASHLRRVIVQTYAYNGWDTVRNIRGRKITLDAFWQEAKRYVATLKYGSELRKDFTGAILARIEDLCDPSRAAIFNSISDISMEELLSRPTIIELKHISDPEFRAFILSLLLIRIYTYFDKLGLSDRLRNLLIIDEAHSLLEEIPRSADSNDTASSKRKAIDQFINIIAESRSFGLGVDIADQNALRLSRDALKTCNTKIIHRITSGGDRRLLADETGCNKEQQDQIDVLCVGEIIIRGADETVPSNVQVFYDPIEYPEMDKIWTDDDVRGRMRSFYEEYADFARTPEPPLLDLEDDIDGSISIAVQGIVTDDGFKEKYIEAVNDPTASDQSLVEDIIAFYAVHATDRSPSSFEVAILVAERASELYRAPSYNLDRTQIKTLISNHIHSFLVESEGEK